MLGIEVGLYRESGGLRLYILWLRAFCIHGPGKKRILSWEKGIVAISECVCGFEVDC